MLLGHSVTIAESIKTGSLVEDNFEDKVVLSHVDSASSFFRSVLLFFAVKIYLFFISGVSEYDSSVFEQLTGLIFVFIMISNLLNTVNVLAYGLFFYSVSN